VPGATGETYPLGVDDVGHRISVQVAMARSGYRDHSFFVPVGSPVTTIPVLDVRATGKPRRAVVVLRVSAPGVAAPGGRFTATVGGRTVTGQVVDGQARVVVRDVRPGTRKVKVAYEGTELVEAARTRVTVTVGR